MELTIQLDAERAEKLMYLQTHGDQDPVSLLSKVIDQVYQEMKAPQKNAYQILTEHGLIGSMDGREPLPEVDEPTIREYLQKKRQEGTL